MSKTLHRQDSDHCDPRRDAAACTEQRTGKRQSLQLHEQAETAHLDAGDVSGQQR